MATFNKEYEYNNVGTIVGTICHVKELARKDGTAYGHEFLVNVKGHGSVNVRIPMLSKSQAMAEKFPANNRPHVRINLAQIDMYHNPNNGKIYTNFVTFAEFKEVGAEVEDTIKGIFKGEIVDFKETNGVIKAKMVIFQTDKDGNLRTKYDGSALAPKQLIFTVEDALLKAQFNEEVQVGTNLAVGYTFTNKSEARFDEWGFPIEGGGRVTKVIAEKLVAMAGKKEKAPEPKHDFDSNPFNADDFFITDEDIPF